jgi:hypothetical protein
LLRELAQLIQVAGIRLIMIIVAWQHLALSGF